ncbi:hypothetical protein [Nguyenibacter vanlangensis]|uniref:hypothetical protein n=1 Tax=Nguyenibacter vanlangensis TaxID=1216886 RepID=UPI001C3FFB82|nr:hypothetical protein [Nguyenibacter vanlangensis]
MKRSNETRTGVIIASDLVEILCDKIQAVEFSLATLRRLHQAGELSNCPTFALAVQSASHCAEALRLLAEIHARDVAEGPNALSTPMERPAARQDIVV